MQATTGTDARTGYSVGPSPTPPMAAGGGAGPAAFLDPQHVQQQQRIVLGVCALDKKTRSAPVSRFCRALFGRVSAE